MTGDLAKTDVQPRWKPEAKKRPARKPAAKRRADVATMAAWHAAIIHKRDAALWTAEDYPMLVEGEKPIHLRRSPGLQAHHVVSRQECRKHGVPEWDVRNGVPVTKRRHERHHSRVEPITRDELPDEIYSFLADYPVLWRYFNRMYPAVAA